MTGSASSFIEVLLSSGLMTAGEVEAVLRGRSPAEQEDSQALAQTFFSHGKLTAYQAKELLAGRTSALVLGNYVILDRLGAGGMGVVFKAHHRLMKRVVALKMLPPQIVHCDEALKRFLREVEAAARLIHPNIVTAYDADVVGETHFLVMQYVEGSDLAHYVRRCGRLSVRTALDYTLQAARGLHYAHQKGVIHRDIKPGNLLLDAEGVVRVLDMGLARFEDNDPQQSAFRTTDELTGTNRMLGTVDYMAPEQTSDARHVDRRADIYSLGCTLHYLLSGRSPTPDGSLTEKLLWHESGPPPSLLTARPDAPPELNVVFRRMMARKPDDRYPSLAETIAELELCLERIAGLEEPTLEHGPRPNFGHVSDTEAVVIPEVVAEQSLSQVSIVEALPVMSSAASDTHRGQTRRDATIVDPAEAVVSRALQARRREQAMVLPAVGLGVCLVVVLVVSMFWYAGRGRVSRTGWNEGLKAELEGLLINGVQKPDGRQLYTEIDTSIEAGRESDWRVGEKLTRDGQAYALRVRNSKLDMRPISRREVVYAGLGEFSVQASLDNSFPHRSQRLVTLAKPQLRLVTNQAGELRLQGTVFSTASAHKSVENATLIVERQTQRGSQVETQASYQSLKWRRLETGNQYIDVKAPQPPPATGDTVYLTLIAFLQEPQPSVYRVSNQVSCAVEAPASAPAKEP